MKIILSDKKKKESFISLFQVLKNCSSLINCTFNTDLLHIQGMDKSHICLFDVKLQKNWFENYDVSESIQICFDSNVFHSIISTKSDNQDLIIRFDNDNADLLHIHFSPQNAVKGEFNKFFKIPLAEYEYEELHIPNVEYDAEFTLSSKQISDIFSQLSNFGNDIIFKCSEEEISLTTIGIGGEMRVDIPIDDLSTYSIVEGEEIVLTYSLTYINKMCITNKLSTDIEFYISNECPMKIHYNLGDDSSMIFYMAPKMND